MSRQRKPRSLEEAAELEEAYKQARFNYLVQKEQSDRERYMREREARLAAEENAARARTREEERRRQLSYVREGSVTGKERKQLGKGLLDLNPNGHISSDLLANNNNLQDNRTEYQRYQDDIKGGDLFADTLSKVSSQGGLTSADLDQAKNLGESLTGYTASQATGQLAKDIGSKQSVSKVAGDLGNILYNTKLPGTLITPKLAVGLVEKIPQFIGAI